MAKPLEGEIIRPEPEPHDYDTDGLTPKEFLLAVMRDKKVPLSVRTDAATKVAVYEHPRLAQTTQDLQVGATIRIEGGLPVLPGTNIIMPEVEPKPPPTKGNGKDPT
jgi:hypothetical protein